MSASEELSDSSREVLIRCFKQFADRKDPEVIDVDRLPDALRFAGINPPEEGCNEIAVLFDKNGDGQIQITELVDNWQQLAQHSITGDEMLEAFKILDLNKDGYIRLPELRAVLMKSKDWTPAEITQLLQDIMIYDKNHDGKFDYPEFVDMIRQNSYPFVKPVVLEQQCITENFTWTKEEKPEASKKNKKTTETTKQPTK